MHGVSICRVESPPHVHGICRAVTGVLRGISGTGNSDDTILVLMSCEPPAAGPPSAGATRGRPCAPNVRQMPGRPTVGPCGCARPARKVPPRTDHRCDVARNQFPAPRPLRRGTPRWKRLVMLSSYAALRSILSAALFSAAWSRSDVLGALLVIGQLRVRPKGKH